jgi:plasmid replication initiation protein
LKDEKDENYAEAKKALLNLNNRVIEYEDDEIWKPMRIIEMPKVYKQGYFQFVVHKELYETLLDFSKGFRKYELKTIMSFDSVYAMRFYELLSTKEGQKITYSIVDLKIMFQLEKKYKQINDFVKRVIEPAQLEMKLKAPLSFEYSSNKIGKRITSINFYPYAINGNKDVDLEEKTLEKKTSLSWDLDQMVVNYLKQNYFFDTDEIKHNRKLFIEASQKLDIMQIMANKRRYCSDRKSPKGSLITILKKELAKVNEGDR